MFLFVQANSFYLRLCLEIAFPNFQKKKKKHLTARLEQEPWKIGQST